MWWEREGSSALVLTVWAAEVEEPGRYPVAGSEYWGLSFIRSAGGALRAELNGPYLQVRVVDSFVGERYWGVELAPHVVVPGIAKQAVLGATVTLPVEAGQVELAGRWWEVPTVDVIEEWVLDVVADGGLVVDDEVAQALAGDRTGASARTWQRRYRRTVGLTESQVIQLHRAQHAYVLLQGGASPAEAAARAGFADQPHLTRALRMIRGLTPAAVIAAHHAR